MKHLMAQQSKNIRRTWVLIAVFCIVIIGLGELFAEQYGNPSILYGFIAFSLVMNITSYWFADKIALKSARAIPADKATHQALIASVDRIATMMQMTSPRVYTILDEAPNAFATGRNEAHAAIAVTTGLLAILTPQELDGVLAHELSHIKNKDILIGTVAVVLAGFIAIFANVFLRMQFLGRNNNRGGNGLVAVLGVLAVIITPIAASLIQLAISRKREFLADASGALCTHHPEHLASALQKIAVHNAPLVHANTATAHLYIVNPFGKGSASLRTLFATHPPVEERIKILLEK